MPVKIDILKLDKDSRIIIEKIWKTRRKIKDLSPFWKRSARPLIVNDVKKVFATDGFGRWKKREDSDETHPLLRDTLKLYNSWTKVSAEGNIYQVNEKSITWGTNLKYAKYQEHGEGREKRQIATLISKTQRGQHRSLQRKVSEGLLRYVLKSLRDA